MRRELNLNFSIYAGDFFPEICTPLRIAGTDPTFCLRLR